MSIRPSLVFSLTVALATVCALILPEGTGGRDSVVRLTRGGWQRARCAEAACGDHDGAEIRTDAPGDPAPAAAGVDDTSPAIPADRVPDTLPGWHLVAPAGPNSDRHPPSLARHAVSDRAPPAR